MNGRRHCWNRIRVGQRFRKRKLVSDPIFLHIFLTGTETGVSRDWCLTPYPDITETERARPWSRPFRPRVPEGRSDTKYYERHSAGRYFATRVPPVAQSQVTTPAGGVLAAMAAPPDSGVNRSVLAPAAATRVV